VSEPLPDVVVATARLRAAIEDTATALAGADLDRLLASDAPLLRALGAIRLPASLTADEQQALLREVDAAHAALRRCRRLGDTLSDFVRFTLAAQGKTLGYGPNRPPDTLLTGRGLNQRA
jgi:hypothetical protein